MDLNENLHVASSLSPPLLICPNAEDAGEGGGGRADSVPTAAKTYVWP